MGNKEYQNLDEVLKLLKKNTRKYKLQEITYLLISIAFIIAGLFIVLRIPHFNPRNNEINHLAKEITMNLKSGDNKDAEILLHRLSQLELNEKISNGVLRVTILVIMFFW